jgi:AcrR family transcriptional regulator
MRVRTEAKRDAIVEAASAVFLASGFEGASMAEIAARVGGSKATLYGYFASKEELFLEVTHHEARRHIEPIFAALAQDQEDLGKALQRFGERTLTVLCGEQSIRARRAIIAESGRSDIGLRFFETGPKRGLLELSAFLDKQVASGKLRPCDTFVAARHLTALLEAETVTPILFGIEKKLSASALRQAVARALETFLAGYGARAA